MKESLGRVRSLTHILDFFSFFVRMENGVESGTREMNLSVKENQQLGKIVKGKEILYL